jgi:NADH:quinone reductase (non-electrogenic)
MLKTAVTEQLGIQYPIVAGCMMSITTPEFVAACSNAGGLGTLASMIYKTPEELREGVRRTKELTDKPFSVNLNLFPSLVPIDRAAQVRVLLDEGVRIIETSGHGVPTELIPSFKEAGITWIHKCAGVRYAKKAASVGADMVTVVGYENGGATGTLDIGTIAMTPCTVDAVGVPVIAGGGIADGRGLAAVLALGAQGAIMGTRLMATKECPIHDNLKQALVKAALTDTVIIMRSVGATHRVWNNAAAQHVLEIEAGRPGDPTEVFFAAAGTKAKEMYDHGDLSLGVVSCGQGIGLVHDVPSVADLFSQMAAEAESTFSRFANAGH